MDFSLTITNVLVFIALAIPGYILIKTKIVKPSAISFFAAVLLYANQPFLTLLSFLEVQYSPSLLINLGIAFVVSLAIQFVVFLVIWLFLRKKYKSRQKNDAGFLQTDFDGDRKDIKKDALRVLTLSCTFGNIGFLGVPLLRALMPLAPEAITYSAVYIVTMNLLSWTVGVAALTGDRRYISVKKAVLNPPTVTLFVALPLFFSGVHLPEAAMRGIAFLGDMTTPMCMLILGMRFATAPFVQIFKDWRVWLASLVKLAIVPLAVLGVLHLLPLDRTLKLTIYILSAMPTAASTLNLSEVFRADANTAANAVLLSTLLCVLTVPALLLLI